MPNADKKRIAEQARSAYRQLKAQRAAEQPRELDTPEVKGIIDPADGTLNKDIIEAGLGLTVIIQKWVGLPEEPTDQNTVSLQWAIGSNPASDEYETVVSEIITGPPPVDYFPKELVVPSENLQPDGQYSTRIMVIATNGEPDYSPGVPLICDSTPPWRNSEPPKMEVPADPITDDYLAAHPDGVECMIPDYSDWQVGDQVAFWWGKEPLPDDPSELPLAGIVDVVGTPQAVTIPSDLVNATGDGGCYAIYALIDKATNRSRLSVYAKVPVALGPLPADLLDPQVPLAAKGWLELEDAFAGVDVEIPEFTNWKPTDTIEVTWGQTLLAQESIGSVPIFPLPIRVPTQILKDEYGNVSGQLETDVSYRVLRGAVPFGPKAIKVPVDFSVIGPELPDWPDPVNPNLPIAKVLGEVSNTLNTLTQADNGKDAAIVVALYSPLNPDELVDFYWGTQHIPEAQYTVQAADVPGDERTVKIPWKYIEEEGNDPALPVHYRIGAPGSPNQQHAETTLVDVSANIITPAAPIFLKLNPINDWLTCVSLDGPDHAVLVEVPDLSQYLSDGDEITLTWTPLAGRSGEVILTDNIKTEPIILGGTTPVTGFEWRVQPYEDHILPTYDPGGAGQAGRARVNYSFIMDGSTVTSLTTEAIVGMFNASGSCPLPAP